MSSMPAFLTADKQSMFINGEWVAAQSGNWLDCIDPATGEQLPQIPAGDATDIDLAVQAAREALSGEWGRSTPSQRNLLLLKLADLLEANGDEISLIDTRDMGAPLWRTRGSIDLMAGILRYNAALALTIEGKTIAPTTGGMFAATVKEPLGVCGAIVPWNSPGWSAVLNLAPVLAAGCTLVLKPAEDASLAPLFLAKLCEEAGIPRGVVNIVTGTGPAAGAALAAHPGIAKISFTGSTVTGKAVMTLAADGVKHVSLELGGKSPNIVFADADLDAAAATAVRAAFGNSGQVCSAGSRLFVERSIAEAFSAKVAEKACALRLGNGMADGVDLGPIVSERQRDRVEGYIGTAIKEGATVVTGGGRPDDAELSNGYFLQPTVLADLTDDMTVVREEIFGPVLCVLPFDTEEEVIARANATPYGLGAAVWTRDIGRAFRFTQALEAGSVWVNCYNALDPAVPAGGYKASGIGREYGKAHLEEYLQTKSVWIALENA